MLKDASEIKSQLADLRQNREKLSEVTFFDYFSIYVNFLLVFIFFPFLGILFTSFGTQFGTTRAFQLTRKSKTKRFKKIQKWCFCTVFEHFWKKKPVFLKFFSDFFTFASFFFSLFLLLLFLFLIHINFFEFFFCEFIKFCIFFKKDRARSMMLRKANEKASSLEEQLKMQAQIEEELKSVKKWEKREKIKKFRKKEKIRRNFLFWNYLWFFFSFKELVELKTKQEELAAAKQQKGKKKKYSKKIKIS